MGTVQKWFERLAGVTPDERARYEFARALFDRQPFDNAALQKPACWRRQTRRGGALGLAADVARPAIR
jgi:hypothetical protein